MQHVSQISSRLFQSSFESFTLPGLFRGIRAFFPAPLPILHSTGDPAASVVSLPKMPKPNKSSATSNTRKKQNAKKGADGKPMRQKTPKPDDPSMKGLTKAQRKALKENRPRVFVPPPRPPVPARPDPLDAQGLARTLPAELVVILRRLGKKDAITRRKGIDELKELWVDLVATAQKSDGQDTDDEISWKEDALTEALPVWVCMGICQYRQSARY